MVVGGFHRGRFFYHYGITMWKEVELGRGEDIPCKIRYFGYTYSGNNCGYQFKIIRRIITGRSKCDSEDKVMEIAKVTLR